jgi:O-antigen/teichoic acid export membrane protein
MPFITLPITTKYLSLSDFGYLALFALCLIPFQVLTEYGAGYVIYSNWFKFSKQKQGELIFSLLLVGTAMTMIVMLLFIFISDLVFPLIAGENWVNIKPLLLFLFIAVISLIPVTIFNFWVVIEQKAVLNGIVKGLEIIFGALVFVLITIYTQNYQYLIIGNVLLGVVLSVIQLYHLIKIIHVRFDKEYFYLIYKISSPIFLRSMFNHIRMQFDKIIVVRLFGPGQFALYNFAGRFNQMFGEFNNSLSQAYQPLIFKGLSNNNLDIKNIRIVFFTWSYIALLFCTFLFFFGKPLIDILTNGLFIDSYPLVVLYTCVLSVSLPFLGNGEVIIHHQKTKYLLVVTIVQASTIAILALLLIPKYGPEGGIVSLWCGSVFMLAMDFRKKMRLYKQLFAEKEILPYVIIFHIIALLKYFEIGSMTNFFLFVFMGTMSVHFYIMNKSLIERILSRIGVKFVGALKQKNFSK